MGIMYHVHPDKVTMDCWDNTNYGPELNPLWQKMVDSIDENLGGDEYDQAVDQIMRKYHAKMIRPKTYPHYMRFPNEKQALMFVLEWS